MSSRQEEKARRRREREEAERQAAAAAARTRRLRIAGGTALVVAIVAVAVVLVAGGGGGGGGPKTAAATDVTLPAPKITNLERAAKRGGCTVRGFPAAAGDHVTTSVSYRTNPPTSGPHNPVPAQDGIYDPGNAPAAGSYVHALEHGRVEIQYRRGAPKRTIDTLTALFDEPINGTPGYHALLFENNTGMKSPVAITAWANMITCPDLDPAAIDALRDFRTRWTDKGPEFVQ